MNTVDIHNQPSVYRYPGIRPFTKEEDFLFFGRNTEIKELIHSLKVQDVFVLFSNSGLGKSSLINAGLLPRLVTEKMAPILIRFSTSDINSIARIAEEVKKYISREKLLSIPEILHHNLWLLFSLWEHSTIPILIFDQFEEFFNYSADLRAQAIAEIADCLENTVPQTLSDRVKENDDFTDSLKNYLFNRFEEFAQEKALKHSVKLLFAIRSDKLSFLDEISFKIPGIFTNRYQLKPLRKDKAEHAIALPAQIKPKNIKAFRSGSYTYSNEAMRLIIDKITNQTNDEIESTLLQIVCQELEHTAISKGGDKNGLLILKPEDFGGQTGIENMINKFYYEQLDKLRKDKNLSLKEEDIWVIREIIEEELLSSLNKRTFQHEDRMKGLLTRVKPNVSVINGQEKEEILINRLLELRLIREEKTHLGGKVYEISHDSLVASIVKARDKRKAEERSKLNEKLNQQSEVSIDVLSNIQSNITCFVTMGFGKKTDFETGRVLDLDKSYKNMIKPAVEAAGLNCIRADEIVHQGLIDVPMYEQLLNADVVIADLSTSNKNAFYELGIRHALRPFTTLVISEDGIKTFPFDIGHVAVRQYHHLGEDIGFEEIMRFRQVLTNAIKQLIDKSPRDADSPVYTFLNGLRPPTLTAEAAINLLSDTKLKVELSKIDRKDWNQESLTQNFLMQQVDEAQRKGDWLIAKKLLNGALQTKQQGVDQKNDPSLLQRLALVTYKSKSPSEIEALEEARNILIQLAPETSNDTETLGSWGAIHKRLWEITNNKLFLDEAIRAYERGFYLRNDYYNGINCAFLLNVRVAFSNNLAEAIADFVVAQRIRKEVLKICKKWLADNPEPQHKNFDDPVVKEYWEKRYWVEITASEALIGMGEEEKGKAMLQEAYKKAPEVWMRESTESQLQKLIILLKNSPVDLLSGIKNSK